MKYVRTLEAELQKREDFCKEFVWGEDNPGDYETLHAKVERLEGALRLIRDSESREQSVLDVCSVAARALAASDTTENGK